MTKAELLVKLESYKKSLITTNARLEAAKKEITKLKQDNELLYYAILDYDPDFQDRY